MAHGTKDYANVQPKITTYTLSDMAELAERLGAVPSLDRLGDVVFTDNFEDGLCKWNKTETGAGTTVAMSGIWSMHGGFSVKVHLPASGAAQAILQKSLSYPVSSMIGLEANATFDTDLISSITYMDFFTAVYRIRYGMKFDIPNGNVYIMNALGSWQLVLSNFFASLVGGIFLRGKFTADLPNLKYRKYVTEPEVIDLSAYSPYVSLDSTRACMSITFQLDGSAGGEIDIYFDSVIVTQNEP